MEKIEDKVDTKPQRRKARIPFGRAEDKSEVLNKHADFHYVWFNDVGDTIARALAGGYEHVLKTDPERVVSGDVTGNTAGGGIDSRVCQVVSRHGTVAFLMRIPNEFYEEDQKARDKESFRPLEDLDKSKGNPETNDGNFYVKDFRGSQSSGRPKSAS